MNRMNRYADGFEFDGRDETYLRETFDLWATGDQNADWAELYRLGCLAIVEECHGRALEMNRTVVELHLIPNRIGTNGTGRNLPVALFAHIASPVEMACQDWTVEITETGVVCGQCSDGHRSQVRHASVAHVRECYSEAARQAAEMAAEVYAEGAYLRWAEGGWDVTGAYSYDPADRWAC